MKKSNAFKAILIVLMLGVSAWKLLGPDTGSEEALHTAFSETLNEPLNSEQEIPDSGRQVSDSQLEEALPQNEPVGQQEVSSPKVTTVEQQSQPLPFKVAPDHNDMFDAAKLFANAMNKELERQWVGIRLETRMAREFKIQSEANLQAKQNELEALKLEKRIESIRQGTVADLDPNKPGGATEKAQEGEAFKDIASIPAIQVVSYTPQSHKGRAFVSLRIDDKSFERVTEGRFIDRFKVVALDDESKCVELLYQAKVPQTACI